MTRDEQHAAYLRSLADPRRMEAVSRFAEELNKAWRERTPEQIAAYELRQTLRTVYADDSEMEADHQGITLARYMRENH